MVVSNFVFRGNFLTISGEACLRHVEVYTSISNNTNMYGHQVLADLTTSGDLRWKRVMENQQWNTIDDELINISRFHRVSCARRLNTQAGQANALSKL